MTNNENEFEYEGRVYVAKVVLTHSCEGCVFDDWPRGTCEKIPVSCCERQRKDGEIAIFKERVI